MVFIITEAKNNVFEFWMVLLSLALSTMTAHSRQAKKFVSFIVTCPLGLTLYKFLNIQPNRRKTKSQNNRFYFRQHLQNNGSWI